MAERIGPYTSAPYHPDVADMVLFTDRTSAFSPISHKGRTIRERVKNAKRIARRAERNSGSYPGKRK